MKKIKVVTIGGGTVGFIVDRGLAKLENIQLTSIASPFDDGGSAGRLKDELGVLPQGDLRRRLVAHDIRKYSLLRDLFLYRFDDGKDLKDHSLGNIILSAAEKLWGKSDYLEKAGEIFNINGSVMLMSLDNAKIAASMSDGSQIVGETNLDLRDLQDERLIDKIYLDNNVQINHKAGKAIQEADYIIICPGDLYTSLIPHFLVNGAKETMKKAKARVIFMTNIMTKFSETRGYNVNSFLSEFEKYSGRKADLVVHNSRKIEPEVLDKYFKEEKSELVVLDKDTKDNYLTVEVPLVSKAGLNNKLIRHDSSLVAKALGKIFSQKLFILDLDDTILDIPKTFYNPDVTYNQSILLTKKSCGLGDLKFKKLHINEDLLKAIKRNRTNVHILLTRSLYSRRLQEDKIKVLNLKNIFKEVVLIDEKSSKKGAIQKILTKYKFNSDTTVVLGDNPNDELQAACQLGLKYIRFKLSGKYIREKDPPNAKSAIKEIENKKDIKDLLKIIRG